MVENTGMRIFSANNKNPCAINLFTKIAPEAA
jgi:hypothetical protein